MNRRKALQYLAFSGGAGVPAMVSAEGEWQNKFARQWRDDFAKHWRNTKKYLLAFVDAMPADGFNFKPTPEQMTFGEQVVHLCHSNTAYISTFGHKLSLARPDPSSKAAVRGYVIETFDRFSEVLAGLTEKDVNRRDLSLGSKGNLHTAPDIMLRAYMHTAQHRGQLAVYLRLKGITPPGWRFEPTA